jgi:SPP1 gp7 family putative phage head morphogenesis protein
MAADPIGKDLRNAVRLRRYENTLGAQVTAILQRARDQLVALLSQQDPMEVSAGRRARRLESLASQANDILTQAYRDINALGKDALGQLAQIQARNAGLNLQGVIDQYALDGVTVSLPTPAELRAIVTAQPVQGAVMWDWWKQQLISTRHAFITQLRIGVVNNETLSQIVQRIRGRAVGRGQYVGGVMDVSTRQAQALVRTAVNDISNQASYATYAANTDLTQEWEFVATLDSRTTPICASLDGTRWRYDDPSAPRPPRHWNCRSRMVPVLNYAGLGLDVPDPAPRVTYPDWFANQSAATQDAILGPTRARLVRNGRADFTDLVRNDGSTATLAELGAD